jgi:hypothetical protein
VTQNCRGCSPQPACQGGRAWGRLRAPAFVG